MPGLTIKSLVLVWVCAFFCSIPAGAQENMWEYDPNFSEKNIQTARRVAWPICSPWADLYSYIPYEGRVEISMKRTCKNVMMRIPEWVESGSDQVLCEVNGKPWDFNWGGRYIHTGKINDGDTVTITFPISERTVKEKIGGVDYTMGIKGNTVVSIDPPGKYNPFYQRNHYRSDRAQWRKVDRFVSDEVIVW